MPAKKSNNALFIGRFQPFHRGHLSVLQDMLPQYDLVVIAIGSSDKSRTPENPFTVGERHAMIKATLEDLGFTAEKDFKIVPVPDIDDNDKYPKHVADLCPAYQTIISGNPIIHDIFAQKSKGKTVIEPTRKYNIAATTVREAIANGEDLEKYLPAPVVSFLQKIGAARKIIDIKEEIAAAEAEEASLSDEQLVG